MVNLAHIYDQMRASPMNDWVGGSDPEMVGDACIAILTRLLPLGGHSRILDFGCGIGRGLVSLHKAGIRPQQLVGMDIMPPVIDFCEQHIAPHLPNTRFELSEGANDHYDRFIEQRERKSPAALTEAYRDNFTDAYAFSVFTHLNQADFQTMLHFVSSMLKPGGRFMFTCFELNEFSRHMVLAGQSIFPLDLDRMREAGDVFIAQPDDPLAFIAFDNSLIRKMVWQAGMAVTKVSYGCWMGGGVGDGLQDAIVCTKLPVLKAVEDVQMTPLVQREPEVSDSTASEQMVDDDIGSINGDGSDKPALQLKKLMQYWKKR